MTKMPFINTQSAQINKCHDAAVCHMDKLTGWLSIIFDKLPDCSTHLDCECYALTVLSSYLVTFGFLNVLLICYMYYTSSTLQLLVPPYHLSTIGRRSFPVAASIIWNTLPHNVQSSPSISTFHHLLKTFLFQQSFPGIIL